MNTPLVEQIAVNILARLNTVTTANGYNVTIEDAVRPTRIGGVTPRDKTAILEMGDRLRVVEATVGSEEWIQTFYITSWVRPSDTSSTAVDTAINLFSADIEKALGTDPHFSTLAIDSWVEMASVIALADGSLEGQILEFNVSYRHVYGDPYTQM